jgi:selenocysteine lyase/cysteine desulfurase
MDISAAQKLWEAEPGYLNTASYGLPPRPAWDALQRALGEWRVGRTSWEHWDDATAVARAAFARLIGVDPVHVAVGSTTSQILAPVAAAVPAGARMVCPDIEFTSAVWPFLARGDGEVRTAPVAALASIVDSGTDVVAFSLVQSATGEVAPYQEIVAAARTADALVVVDATQAFGWLPFDASLADVVVVAGYKWLMAPRGVAYAYLDPAVRDRMTAFAAGWYAAEDVHGSYYGPPLALATSARRFDISPAWFSFVGAAPALELVERIGVPAIHDHNVALANRFLAGLGQPLSDSAIVTVDVPDAERKLAAAGIRAAVRNARVRASFHVYTRQSDVDDALTALA